MSILQVAEQELLLTIPLSLPCGAGKGRTMKESDSHTADSLCLLTAGNAKLTSDLQSSFNYRQVPLLLKNVTSNT